MAKESSIVKEYKKMLRDFMKANPNDVLNKPLQSDFFKKGIYKKVFKVK